MKAVDDVLKPADYYRQARDAYALAEARGRETRMELYAKASAAALVGLLMISVPAAVWFEDD